MSEKFVQTPHYLISIQIVPQNFEVILTLPHHTQIEEKNIILSSSKIIC
jgi:hypothetical protein